MHYFENKLNNELFDYIFNHSLYESSGHPLFIYDDADKMELFLNKFKNLIEIINKCIPKLRIEKEGNLSLENNPNRKYFVNVLKSFSIPMTDFGFDDIIDVGNHKFKIDIINVIDNDITYEDIAALTDFSSGSFAQVKNSYIKKNQYKNDHIVDIINGKCIAVNGKILPQSFLSIFFHEYIHLYDNFNRLKTYKDNYLNFYNRVNDAANRENQIKHYFSGNEENAIKYLLYRLFNGEDNAIIGDLFADLISYNVISYNDYKRNIKYMRSFRIYEKCKNALNIIKDVDAFSLFNAVLYKSVKYDYKKKERCPFKENKIAYFRKKQWVTKELEDNLLHRFR